MGRFGAKRPTCSMAEVEKIQIKLILCACAIVECRITSNEIIVDNVWIEWNSAKKKNNISNDVENWIYCMINTETKTNQQ